MVYRLIGLGLLAGLLSLGCGGSEEQKQEETGGPLAGNWLLSLTRDYQQDGYQNVNTVLLHIEGKEGDYTAKLRGSKPSLPEAKLKSFDIKKDKVHLVLTSGGYTLDFVGAFDGKSIPGNIDFGSFNIEPAQLSRTSVADVAQAPVIELPANRSDYDKLIRSLSDEKSPQVSLYDHYEAFLKFCETYPQSPLAVMVYQKLVYVLPQKAADEAQIKDFAKGYFKASGHWGPRMETLAKFNLGESLAGQTKFADLGLAYLKQSEAEMDAAKKADLQIVFAAVRRRAQQMQAREQALAARTLFAEGEQEEALQTLRDINEKYPFDPVLMFHRAEAARLANHPEEAMRLYAQLTIWPRLQETVMQTDVWLNSERELPQSRLRELWVKQQGSQEGLQEYQDKIYAGAAELIAERIGRPAAPPAGNRVSLVELFTGAACPPCVGADLATAALEHLYPKSNLLVLRYHVHIPGPDPLTNAENYARFEALLGADAEQGMATPSVFINGSPTPPTVGGFLDNATRIGKSLHETIRPALDAGSPLKLTLSASRHKEEITVAAHLGGVPQELANKLRVVLLLAEGEIDFPAANGIRRHEMVVRWMYNGAKGSILNTGGEFQFSTKTRLSDIRELITSNLHQAAETLETEFKDIPLALDGLRLVGFVHNTETREILQAASVPVEIRETAPKSPMPKLPDPKPITGPKLVPPGGETQQQSSPEPAKAEKPPAANKTE